jgi:hypothetical protein
MKVGSICFDLSQALDEVSHSVLIERIMTYRSIATQRVAKHVSWDTKMTD